MILTVEQIDENPRGAVARTARKAVGHRDGTAITQQMRIGRALWHKVALADVANVRCPDVRCAQNANAATGSHWQD